MVPGAGSAGRTKSVFDVFREDISTAVTSNAVENTFFEVRPFLSLTLS